DGLVHISQLSDHFVSNPHKEVKVNRKVEVTVVEIDKERNRIGLSMKKDPDFPDKSRTGGTAPRGGRKSTGERGKVGKPASKKERESRKSEYSEDNPFYQHFKNKKK
ncbi:MAG: S1 RNA-binding domain-containing protein, partial [Spirochaetales bacterium]|nr:S1 RNA-binding domain-containing protein [Spirochaetales bacterium]